VVVGHASKPVPAASAGSRADQMSESGRPAALQAQVDQQAERGGCLARHQFHDLALICGSMAL
jgi:hypothetical protein